MDEQRTAWRIWQARIRPQQLVFLDETGADTKMTRRFGRSFRGQRLVSKVPHGSWHTTTFLAGLRLTGLTAPLIVEGDERRNLSWLHSATRLAAVARCS